MDLTLGPLALLVVHGKFCLLMNKKVSTWGYIYVWPDASWTTSAIASTSHFWGLEKAVTADQAANTLKEQR